MNKQFTTIRVEEQVKDLVNRIKKKHRYSNVSILIEDMTSFFEMNDISPRTIKEPVTKKIQAFRDSLFKKLGAFERDYYKAHYHDFNLVSGYLKKELDVIKTMLADKRSVVPKNKVISEQKQKAVIAKKADPEAKTKLIETAEYAFELFEDKAQSKGDNLLIDKSDLITLKSSIINLISR